MDRDLFPFVLGARNARGSSQSMTATGVPHVCLERLWCRGSQTIWIKQAAGTSQMEFCGLIVIVITLIPNSSLDLLRTFISPRKCSASALPEKDPGSAQVCVKGANKFGMTDEKKVKHRQHKRLVSQVSMMLTTSDIQSLGAD